MMALAFSITFLAGSHSVILERPDPIPIYQPRCRRALHLRSANPADMGQILEGLKIAPDGQNKACLCLTLVFDFSRPFANELGGPQG